MIRGLLRTAVVGSVVASVVVAGVTVASAQCMPSKTSRAAIVQVDAAAPAALAAPVSASDWSGSARGAALTQRAAGQPGVLEPDRCIMLGDRDDAPRATMAA